MSRLSLFHFPEAVIHLPNDDHPAGPGTINPVGISIEKLFKWMFQVREWDIVADVTCEAIVDGTSAIITYEDFIFEKRYDPTDESQLTVPSVGTKYRFSNGEADKDATPIANAFASGRIGWEFLPVGVVYDGKILYDNDANLYYPPMLIKIIVGANGSGSFGSSLKSYTIGYDSDGEPTERVMIDGEEAFFKRSEFEEDFGTGASTSVSISGIRVVPSKYWKHDDGTGPAYDEDNGDYLL